LTGHTVASQNDAILDTGNLRRSMVSRYAVMSLLFVASGLSPSAQSGQPTPSPQPPAVKLQPGETAVAGECLTKEELDVNRALQALTRPTRGVEAGENADEHLRFNPHYFTGKWTLEGVLPESPLAPAGEVTGVETVRHLGACTYEGTLQAKGPGGPFTVKSVITYDRQAGYMVRLEQDSRGFQLLEPGVIGGDAGGYFSHHWESAQFTFKGKRIRLRGTTLMASPDNHRLRMQISIDDGPFANYGTLWFTREGATRE